jgi:hypothetical protein
VIGFSMPRLRGRSSMLAWSPDLARKPHFTSRSRSSAASRPLKNKFQPQIERNFDCVAQRPQLSQA